jgi:hypothetical protein
VERVTHLGFEVRVDLKLDVGGTTWVQLSRGAANELDLVPDDQVWVTRATPSSRRASFSQVVG